MRHVKTFSLLGAPSVRGENFLCPGKRIPFEKIFKRVNNKKLLSQNFLKQFINPIDVLKCFF